MRVGYLDNHVGLLEIRPAAHQAPIGKFVPFLDFHLNVHVWIVLNGLNDHAQNV